MSKRVVKKPPRSLRPGAAQSKKPSALNPRLSAQTRKILLKHYRTKYAVRHRGGGR